MLKLILGRAGRGKTARILNEIKARVERREAGQILIVPEQYSHAAERELCEKCGDAVSLYGEVLSFSRLADRVMGEMGLRREDILDGGGRILTMRLALNAAQSRIKGIGLSRKTQYLEELLRVVDEVKRCMVTPAMLETAAAAAQGKLGDKLFDLALILEAYDAVSRGRDPADKMALLGRKLPGSQIGNMGHIYIDGFTDFTAQEFEAVKGLMGKGAGMTVALTCDGLTGDTEIFESARKTAVALKNFAEAAGTQVSIEQVPAQDAKNPEMAFLEENLFSARRGKFMGKAGGIAVIAVKSPVEECRLAAARVSALVREAGYRYRDIAVTARGFGDYETAAENIFARDGIPVYISRKADIMQKPVMLLITSALEIINGGWRYEALFRYLKTGLTGITAEDCDLLENYVLQWSISGSLWTRAADWTESPRGYGKEAGPREQKLLQRINGIRKRVALPLKKLGERGKSAKTAAGQVMALYSFLEDIALPVRLTEKAKGFQLRGHAQLGLEYGQLWGILVRAMEQCEGILGDCPMDQRAFWDLFRLTLSQYDAGTIPVSLDAVGMGDMERMRSRDIRCLIILGVTDERMPAVQERGGLLTDRERQKLRELGIVLSELAEEKFYREMNLIYNTFTMAADKLIILYPQRSAEGEEKRPSPVVSRILELFPPETADGGVPGELDLVWSLPACLDLALKARREPDNSTAAAAKAYIERSGSGQERFSTVLESADVVRGRLSAASALRLYGEKLCLSASRADSFASCHFRYFMQYGLLAAPRKRAVFDAPAAGLFMHYILENVTREIKAGGGFAVVEEAEWKQIVKKYADRYVREELQDFREKTDRFRYLFRRLLRDVYQVVGDIVAELKQSEFTPYDFELKFGAGADMPPLELPDKTLQMSLSGTVDRVDGWAMGGKLHLRVVDYKTGKKGFKLSDIWYGMGMQMLIYLFALREGGSRRYGGVEIAPAGVLYVPARDIFVPAPPNSTDEEIEKLRLRQLRRSGLLIADPVVLRAMDRGDPADFIPVKFGKNGEVKPGGVATYGELERLERHVQQKLIDMGREMKSGDVAAAPCFGSVDSPCAFCEYTCACQFDEGRDKRRYLPELGEEEVLARILAETEERGRDGTD